MERWCNHDEPAIGDDGVCECGFGPLSRRIEALMRLLVDGGHATPQAQRAVQRVLAEEAEGTRPDPPTRDYQARYGAVQQRYEGLRASAVRGSEADAASPPSASDPESSAERPPTP